jgi:hypothetical protein
VAGDGHIPWTCTNSQFNVGGVEAAKIEIWPILGFDLVGMTTFKWHLLGECLNLTAGKSVTVRLRKGNAFADPIIGTWTIAANGFFHEVLEISIPAPNFIAGSNGGNPYLMSFQTDNLVQPAIRDFLVVVETFAVAP